MKRVLSLLLVGLLAIAAPAVVVGGQPGAAQAATCDQPPAPKTILTVGDSITAGAILTTSYTDSYRAELGRLLAEHCVSPTFLEAGVGGSTCGYWSTRMADLITTHRPDIVLIACGTNDRSDTKTAAQMTAWEGTYRALFDTVLDLDPDVLMWPAWIQYSAGHPAAGCTTPPGPSPAWLPASEAEVNDAIYRAMLPLDEWGGRVPTWIDYQVIPEGYLDECGVHPTPGGYDVMGRLAYNTMAPALGLPTVPAPCGLVGRRPGYGPPITWTPCQGMNL